MNEVLSLPQIRLDLARRIATHAQNGTTDRSDIIMRNDVSVYIDPERFEQEKQKLFLGLPQTVCLSNDLPAPGHYVLFEDLGIPMIVLRDKTGKVRAFLNTCIHRGAKLVTEPKGKLSRITCMFHAWTFDLDGALKAVPQSQHFCDLHDRQQLVEYPADERYGIVFVQATVGGSFDLDAHLGDYASQLKALRLDQAEWVASDVLRSNANWKFTLDTYVENYHFATVHRDSLTPTFANNMLLFDSWGPHHRVVFPTRVSEGQGKLPESEWDIDSYPIPFYIFPNTIIFAGSLSPGQNYITVFRHYPDGLGKMYSKVAIYAPEGIQSREQEEAIKEAFTAIVTLLQNEDYEMTSSSYKNLSSLPGDFKVIYGRTELALQNMHLHFAQAIGAMEPEITPATAPDGAALASGAA